MRKLQFHVMKQSGVVTRWYRLGIRLLHQEDLHLLQQIKANHPNNVHACCTEMFEAWLQTRIDACWDQLCEALAAIDLPVAAVKIKEKIYAGICMFAHMYVYMHIHTFTHVFMYVL